MEQAIVYNTSSVPTFKDKNLKKATADSKLPEEDDHDSERSEDIESDSMVDDELILVHDDEGNRYEVPAHILLSYMLK